MRKFRFLLSWEWAGYLAMVIVFAVACYGLSQWQFARREQVVANIEKVEKNYESSPVAVNELLADLDSFDLDDEYRQVVLTGEYLRDHQVLVRNRPLSGQPGYEVLVPFLQDDGTVFAVNRGWLPTGSDGGAPDQIPEAPEGRVTVTARLKQAQPDVSRTAPEGQIASFYLPAVATNLGYPMYTAAFGLLASESPPPSTAAPMAIPKPSTDEGSHLSYAFQWLAFGVLAFIGFFYAIRATKRRVADAGGDIQKAKLAPAKRQKWRDPDAETEDALLDTVGR